MNTPIFEEKDFSWAHMLGIGQIRVMPDGHVREMSTHGCTEICPHCNPKSKDKLPLIILTALLAQGAA